MRILKKIYIKKRSEYTGILLATVSDAGPALYQHWASVMYLVPPFPPPPERRTRIRYCSRFSPDTQRCVMPGSILKQCRPNAGSMPGQHRTHWASIRTDWNPDWWLCQTKERWSCFIKYEFSPLTMRNQTIWYITLNPYNAQLFL